MFDIITFGSSTMDIFFKLDKKNFKVLKKKGFASGKGVCFSLGSKIRIKDMLISSGGGGTNTAATFAKQGFKTAFCGKVGDDLAGREIVEELKKLKIDTSFVSKTSARATNTSVVLTSLNLDRTILTYRGASELLCKTDIPWRRLKTKWFYLAPLSGMLCNITKELVEFAYKNSIKIALNPGNSQLALPRENLKSVIKKTDILILNQEEASLLTGISYQREAKIFNAIDRVCPGIAIMTKGKEGVVVSDGKHLYRAKTGKIKVADRTGAGDSFGSGFVAGFIRSKGNIEKAIQLGIANASACLGEWGAKGGLLKKGQKFSQVKIDKTPCLESDFCCNCR